MAIVEHTPYPVFTSRILSKLLTWTTAGRSTVSKQPGRGTAAESRINNALPTEAAIPFRNHTSARHLMRIIAESDAHAASIIGIVGARPKMGVTVTSRQLASAFASFGRKVLLVDASRTEFSDGQNASPAATIPALADLATEVNPAISLVNLASVTGLSPIAPAELSQALKTATRLERIIIVDLPPIVHKSGLPNMATSVLGAACDLLYLVCLTGNMRRKELSECVETCKIVGLKLNGLILNDWRLTGNRLLDR